MSISYPLTLPVMPVPQPSRVLFSVETQNAVTVSPWTFQQQVQEHEGEILSCQITLPSMLREHGEEWAGVIASLKGRKGTFMIGDPSAPAPKGQATGAPLVRGGGQIGSTLITDGWTAGVTNILKRGDKFQIGNRLYIVMQNVNSDGSGIATIEIMPRLRESPGDNETLITVNPKGQFRLLNNKVDLWEVGSEGAYSVSFEAMEAI